MNNSPTGAAEHKGLLVAVRVLKHALIVNWYDTVAYV